MKEDKSSLQDHGISGGLPFSLCSELVAERIAGDMIVSKEVLQCQPKRERDLEKRELRRPILNIGGFKITLHMYRFTSDS